jgi:hypothetical protein
MKIKYLAKKTGTPVRRRFDWVLEKGDLSRSKIR